MKFLVVDSDKANVKYLQGALQSLGCEVKACRHKEQALSLLREQKKRFDIVLVDVGIPYEMGFKFIEIVSSKMNIPIIMMCSTSDNEIIAAGMNSGACQVAVKPINDIRRFFQCAFEHRTQHLLGVSNLARNPEGFHGQENGSSQGAIEGTLYKNRLVWTEDLKALFIKAVHALGGKDVAVPRKIKAWMNVPNLTRENIASHLQKYRLSSVPNYVGDKRKRKAAQAMQVNGIDEQAPDVAHPNRRVRSFEAPEFASNAQNVSMQQQFGQIEGKSIHSPGMNTDSMQVNGITGYGNQQGAYFEEPKIAQFPIMPKCDIWQQLYGSPNVQPYVPEPPAVPPVFRDSCGPSLPAQSSSELQVPSDGIRSQETPTSLDAVLESFLDMDIHDLYILLFDECPPQDMSMIFGGLSNGLHTGDGRNDLATDSLINGTVEATNPMAMHYPLNNSFMGGMVDHSNSPGQQQEQIIGSNHGHDPV